VLVAHVQGQIYERLYCPEAIGLGEGVRYERAQALAGELREIESFMCEATVGLRFLFVVVGEVGEIGEVG